MYDVRWVHVFEEDHTGGQVYRLDTGAIPLSRRAREAFELHPDGAACLFSGGPDDRSVEHAATWSDTSDGIVVVADDGSARFRIVAREPSRLVVRQD